MTGQHIGPYRVLREIGRGGMGAVFEAVHTQIERKVAIKILRSEFAQNQQLVARFVTEARAVNIVNHPSVVQISDCGQLPDGLAYIVMEYLEGESLGSRMKRQGGRLTIPEALRLTRQIAAALAAAHSKGIIHRDLIPPSRIAIRLFRPVAQRRKRLSCAACFWPVRTHCKPPAGRVLGLAPCSGSCTPICLRLGNRQSERALP